ncbi:MAG: helix-turn-helix domain-containing protein [Lewinella sp.]|nr:helix-turn-helix domain-containing protein [Lewinella sp.]
MKPTLEKIEPNFGNSFFLRKFEEVQCNTPEWHFHPEYEIVYISNGRGKRHIGDHISHFEDGDLIFLGPNLPHFGFTEEVEEQHVEIVIQLREDFLGEVFWERPELQVIRQLFARAETGLSFRQPLRHQLGRQLVAMTEMDPFPRLLVLLQVLHAMAITEDYDSRNAKGFAGEVHAQDQDRMEALYGLVQEKFRDGITLDEAAGLINMTKPAFCRYFKRMTNRTFTQFVNEFRVAHARRLLKDESQSIAAISFESGFNNLSHFNKQFRLITGSNPREFRKSAKRVIHE